MSFTSFRQTAGRDFLASIVVFLVALPLCMGIAIASGAPPAAGIISGIVGGLVVGALGGAPLPGSGPAAGLAVIVWDLVQTHGFAALGPILIIAGLVQVIAGVAKLGRWFQAVPPSVIYGMLAGIGVLIFASQFHVMVDDKPKGSPAALVGVVTATIVARVIASPVAYVTLPDSLLGSLSLPNAGTLASLLNVKLIGAALGIALVASAETLLCAGATDRMHNGERTNYDREMLAQGVGNTLCGVLGGLPMTGVIVRSTANIQAGAKTRASAILHGAWLLASVAAIPFVLRFIPVSSLAALLVYTGYKLVRQDVRALHERGGRVEVFIFLATVAGVVGLDLLKGVALGLGLAFAKIVWTFSRLRITHEREEAAKKTTLRLEGSATFLGLPQLIAALAKVPEGDEVDIHFGAASSVDHGSYEALAAWEKQHVERGGRVRSKWPSGSRPRLALSGR